MARNDYLLDKPDNNDQRQFNDLVRKALLSKRKIEDGFLDLAESMYEINHKKLYKIQYKTFSEFCEEELGFSRQTIYVYMSILKLITMYPDYFPRDKAIALGHKKMRFITEGVNEIDKRIENPEMREEIKKEIFNAIHPDMASTEIESYIEDRIEKI